jgi:hypothetical protein
MFNLERGELQLSVVVNGIIIGKVVSFLCS